MLLCRQDSSIWYLDLSDDWRSTATLEPRLLVPAIQRPPGPYSESGWHWVRVTLAVDWTSPEALGPSYTSHSLTQFNIAVLVRVSDVDPMRVNVWKVQVHTEHCGSQSLRLGEHLSSFAARPNAGALEADLYAGTLAYRVYDERAYIVDWRELNGRNGDDALLGRCIATGHSRWSGDVPLDINVSPYLNLSMSETEK